MSNQIVDKQNLILPFVTFLMIVFTNTLLPDPDSPKNIERHCS